MSQFTKLTPRELGESWIGGSVEGGGAGDGAGSDMNEQLHQFSPFTAMTPRDIAATVTDCEYLGADSLFRCQIGSEQITGRIAGQLEFSRGQVVHLRWPPDAVHYFNQQGLRVH